MAQQKAMTLLEFQEHFHNEEACIEHLYKMRWPEGFVCPKCGCQDEPYNVSTRKRYQCRHCNHQTSVTAGTVMHRTRVPLVKWFWTMYLMSHDKRGCSAKQIERELSLGYATAWLLCHKIRSAMGERDTQYVLDGYIEVDDAFFGAPGSNGKRGRGTDKTVVLVGLSLDKKGKPQFAKMQVAPNVKGETLERFADENIAAGSMLSSDGFSAYQALREGYDITQKAYDPINDPTHLKWLHVVVSNAKSFIMGTYHGLGAHHLQRYLNEFCYRFNRRKFTLQHFNRTLFSCISAPIFTYHELTR